MPEGVFGIRLEHRRWRMLKPSTILIALSTGAVAATFGLGFINPAGPFHNMLNAPTVRSATVRSPQFTIPAINYRTSAPTRTDMRLVVEISNPNKTMDVCHNAPRIQDYLLRRFSQNPAQLNIRAGSVKTSISDESISKGIAGILGKDLITKVTVVYQHDRNAASLLPKSDFVPCPEGLVIMPLLKG